ncbi:hypothetical protein XINFAN_03669 [Pseudogemmobacter humi]|uniref:Uncharacterized protein n=1 Tax=Pseudogemmobacter humi TaxID=2483812 RepID=A0A3P5XQK2_9RHOB|nr:hypothetical protein XINFAN_03669 [Pseudogemmobacter humi]
MVRRSTSGPSGTLRAWTFRIFSRPLISGFGTWIWRSNRPGRSSAGSSTSFLLVAAMMITPSLASNPSISTRSWFSVCSRSSLPPPMPTPRARPTASISSMKTMQGAFFLACSNMSRTRLAPTPTNISTKSEPEMVKNGTPASPAMARARSVLPVPGGPTSSAPLGILPPSRENFCGLRRNSTISSSSSLASSIPATSSKVTRPCFSVSSFARDLPKPMAPPLPPPCIRFMKKIQIPISTRNGSHSEISDMKPDCCCGVAWTSTPWAISFSVTCSSPGLTVEKVLPSLVRTVTRSPSSVTEATRPASTCSMKSDQDNCREDIAVCPPENRLKSARIKSSRTTQKAILRALFT